MMKKLRFGQDARHAGGMQMPGMAAAAGGARKNAKNINKKKARSGNPQKRAAQEAAAKAQQARAGAAFGQQAQSQEMDLSSMNLPKGFEKFLQ